MATLLRPGFGFLYMKVGTHARESLEDIIARKTKEIENEGHAFWGYGGNTCHPQTMVQPFVKSFEERGQTVYLCMEPMDSKHFAEQVRAEQFSLDGIKWEIIPPTINVLGSRYALAIKNLHLEKFDLSLDHTRVAIGNSVGAVGTSYIRGRVDKACLEMVEKPLAPKTPGESVQIKLVAELVAPYAVYLRNKVG